MYLDSTLCIYLIYNISLFEFGGLFKLLCRYRVVSLDIFAFAFDRFAQEVVQLYIGVCKIFRITVIFRCQAIIILNRQK